MVMENEIRLGDVLERLVPSDSLPEQVPVEQFTQYRVEDLQHILYIRIELKSEFEQ